MTTEMTAEQIKTAFAATATWEKWQELLGTGLPKAEVLDSADFMVEDVQNKSKRAHALARQYQPKSRVDVIRITRELADAVIASDGAARERVERERDWLVRALS